MLGAPAPPELLTKARNSSGRHGRSQIFPGNGPETGAVEDRLRMQQQDLCDGLPRLHFCRKGRIPLRARRNLRIRTLIERRREIARPMANPIQMCANPPQQLMRSSYAAALLVMQTLRRTNTKFFLDAADHKCLSRRIRDGP
jgi:hypothetical protein